MAFTAGEKTVTTAGTPEALTASSNPVSGVTIQAKPSNTGSVYVGDSGAQHLELFPGENVVVSVDDTDEIFLDVDTDGEGVNFVGG